MFPMFVDHRNSLAGVEIFLFGIKKNNTKGVAGI
jgi:hypothetical protein